MASHSSRFNFEPGPNQPGKERVGPAEDGGYVINPVISSETTHLVSLGIGGDERFELDFVSRYGSKVVMVDPGYAPDTQTDWAEKTLRLSGKAIPESPLSDSKSKDGTHKFSEIIERVKSECGPTSPSITLKIDIEWDEWDLLASISQEDWATVDQLIVEFHFNPVEQHKQLSPYFTGFFESVYGKLNEQVWQKYLNVLNALRKNFWVFHVHANNSLPTHNYFGQRLPYLLEVTWLSHAALKKMGSSDQSQYNQNHQLDFRNKSDRPDVGLMDWNQN
jgi:hypothetical protein